MSSRSFYKYTCSCHKILEKKNCAYGFWLKQCDLFLFKFFFYINYFIQIYDSSGRLESYCGLRNPFSILSMNNSITLMFKSNLAINRRGFVAEYETIGLKLLQTNHAIQQWQIIISIFFCLNLNVHFHCSYFKYKGLYLKF